MFGAQVAPPLALKPPEPAEPTASFENGSSIFKVPAVPALTSAGTKFKAPFFLGLWRCSGEQNNQSGPLLESSVFGWSLSRSWLYVTLLYISTRGWVLRTPNAGRNIHIHFQHFLCTNFLLFLHFFSFAAQKKRWKLLFWPGFGLRSTQTLVEIYNNQYVGVRYPNPDCI